MDRIFENLSLQIRFAMSFSLRDAPKRVGTSSIACGILYYFGAVSISVTLLALILLFESLRLYASRETRSPTGEISRIHATLFTLIYCASTFFYCSIGSVFLQMPYATAQVFGVFWMSAIAIHTISVNTMISTLSWLTVTSVALAVLLAAVQWSPPIFLERGNWDGTLFGLVIFLWVGNLIQSTKIQGSNRTAFTEARRKAEERLERLEYLASHDALTGLMNRRALDEAGEDAVQFGDASALISLDLNGFKPINDAHGHAAGDAVLVEVARRIAEVAQGHIAARVGGDEFMILVRDPADKSTVEALVAELDRVVKEPILHEGLSLSVSAAIGQAKQTKAMENVDDLYRASDKDMYRAKEWSRSQRNVGNG